MHRDPHDTPDPPTGSAAHRGVGPAPAVLLLLMVVQAAVGLAVGDLYPEEPWAVAAFRGNDLVTLLLAAPVLAVALFASRRDATSASVLVWLGMLHYGVYNYAYYSFGGAFSSVFLLHVAAFVASMAALLMLATSIDAGRRPAVSPAAPAARVVAAFTTLVGLALVAAWGGLSVRFALTGELPQDVMPPSAVHLVYAIDLSLLAPVFVVAGVLLWRREPWGSVLAVAINASGAVYLAVLWAVGGFQADAGIAGKTWLSPVAIGSVLACLARDPGAAGPPAAGVADRPHSRRRRIDPGTSPRLGREVLAHLPGGRRGGGCRLPASGPMVVRRPGSPPRRRRASRGGCRPSTSRAWAPWPRSTSPAPGGRRGETRTA